MANDGRHIIELAELLPARNINFHIEACQAMSAVKLQDISGFGETDTRRLKSLIVEKGLQAKPREAIDMLTDHLKSAGRLGSRESMKILGKFIITHLRDGEFKEKAGPFTKLPLSFLSYAVIEDLLLHGRGPNYSLVGRFLDELAEREIIEPDFSDSATQRYDLLRSRCAQYTDKDIAAIFLGYSLAHSGSPHPIIPFPARPEGFVSVLISEVKKLTLRSL